jgi:hypothetical protein
MAYGEVDRGTKIEVNAVYFRYFQRWRTSKRGHFISGSVWERARLVIIRECYGHWTAGMGHQVASIPQHSFVQIGALKVVLDSGCN